MVDLANWLPTRIAPSFIDLPVVDLTRLRKCLAPNLLLVLAHAGGAEINSLGAPH